VAERASFGASEAASAPAAKEPNAAQKRALEAKREEKATAAAEEVRESSCPVCGAATLEARDTRAIEQRPLHLEPEAVRDVEEEARLVGAGCRTYQAYGRVTVRVYRRGRLDRAARTPAERRVLREHWCTSIEAGRRRAAAASLSGAGARLPAGGAA